MKIWFAWFHHLVWSDCVEYSHGVNFRCILTLVTELARITFNVVLIVIVSYNSDIFLRLQVNYYLFAMSFSACGYGIVLRIFGFW